LASSDDPGSARDLGDARVGASTTRCQVPVAAVAQTVLTLVAGTDEPLGDGAGRAAARLLVVDPTGA